VNSPPKEKAATGTKTEAAFKDSPESDSSTPWRVVIRSRAGREITWNRFASRADAAAELQLLHQRGVRGAFVEGAQ